MADIDPRRWMLTPTEWSIMGTPYRVVLMGNGEWAIQDSQTSRFWTGSGVGWADQDYRTFSQSQEAMYVFRFWFQGNMEVGDLGVPRVERAS